VRTSLRRLELGVGLSLIAVGAFAAWEALRMPQGTAALPGPGVLPFALGVLIAACALVLIVARTSPDQPVTVGNRQVVCALLAVLAAGLLWERAGFLISSTFFLFVLLWMLSPLGWWRSLIAAAVGAAAARFVFQNLLNVVLPPLPFAY
jgi:putative tricarboxylic transport membrane protein